MARLKRRLPWVITDKLTVGSTHITEASLSDGLTTVVDVTPGTAAAEKAVVLDASKDIATLGEVTAATFVGDLMGDVTGDVTGDVDGNLVGQHRHEVEELTETGAITLTSGVVLLNHIDTAIEATLAAPTAGDELYIINNAASGTAAHTVTCADGVTFDGTNDVATLDAPGKALHLIAISATRWFVLENIGTIVLSESVG